MRRPISWTARVEDRVKREVRVSFSGGKLKWQFKRSDQEQWDYDSEPSASDWKDLLAHAEARYRRNRIPHKVVELIRKNMPTA